MSYLLFIDFETFFAPKEGYGLKELSIVEYVRSPRFKPFGFAAAIEGGPVLWYSYRGMINFMNYVPWPKTTVVGHNIKFDGFIITQIFGRYPKAWIDTKGMSRAVLGKTIKNHSLSTLAEHFGLPSKGTMKTEGLETLTEAQEIELAEYCKHDVELCREIYKKLAPEFPENQYKYMSRTIDMFVRPRLQLNVPLLEKAAKDEKERREKIFETIGIPKTDFASNKKFPEILRAKGYDCPTKPSPKKLDSEGKPLLIPALALGDPQFLEMLESENEELRKLCEARVAAKSTLLETRAYKLGAIGATGLWPFDTEFSGADQTHRFSGGSGAGGNPQNFTRDSALREAVQAPAGYKLVVGDFANIEMRLVAYLAKDPGLIQAIEEGRDIYCEFASAFFGRKITKQDENERRFGKTAILGLGYGMGWKKFIKTVRVQTGQTITEEDSKKAISLYRTLYSKVPLLWEMLDKQIPILASGFNQHFYDLPIDFGSRAIILPSKLQIRFPNLRQEVNEKGRFEWIYDVYTKGKLEKRKLYGGKVLENISQGLAGELCKEAFEKLGQYVTGLVHDEIHLVVPEEAAEIAAERLEEIMSSSPVWMPELQLKAEVGVGNNWKDAK